MTQFVVSSSNIKHFISQKINEFQLRRLLPDLTAGLIIGILELIFSISLASLVFAGDLSDYTSIGIVMTLLGAMIIAIVISLFSSFAGTIAAPQEAPAVILALMAASISNSMPAGSTVEETFLTVVAAIALTSILTGLLFLVLGYYKLGELVRFFPYPVIGGFLAGTGWLLVTGAISVVTDVSPSLSTFPILLQSNMLLRWLPALIFAILLLVILNRYNHFLIMPAMILGAVGLFFVVMWLTNISIAELNAQGWFLEPPEQGLSQSFTFSGLTKVNWLVIFKQTGNVATLLVISVVALLFSASGLELVVSQDIDLNRELQAAGIGNVIGGLCGGMVGFHVLSESTLSQKLGGSSRLVGIVVAALCGLVLFGGMSLLYFFPKIILGSMLMMLGLFFLYEWVYLAWFKFPRIDFVIIIAILIVIAAAGFLQGIVFGGALAVVMFVVNYSRINVVKNSLSGSHYQSRITRCRRHRQILENRGNEILILQLHGFIFFGTANNLLNQVQQRIEASRLPRLHFAVLDFRQVTGLDSTAMLSFRKMIQLARSQQIVLVFTNPAVEHAMPGQENFVSEFFAQLNENNQSETDKTIRMFPNLDYGLEWCENQILQAAGINLINEQKDLRTLLRSLLPDDAYQDSLLRYFERLEVGSGYYLMEQGDLPKYLHFIESGQVSAQVEFPDRNPVRLETIPGGRMVGEIEFFLKQPCSAAVVTEEPSTIYRISAQTLKDMVQNDPKDTYAFQQIENGLVSERLTYLINTVNYLQR